MMSLEALDLNLLLVLHHVLAEGSVVGASRRLHVTPSAVSNGLARLRELLGDPLLVRHGRALVPTPRARELAPRVAAAVAELRGLFGRRRPSSPRPAAGASPWPPPTTWGSCPAWCNASDAACPGRPCGW